MSSAPFWLLRWDRVLHRAGSVLPRGPSSNYAICVPGGGRDWGRHQRVPAGFRRRSDLEDDLRHLRPAVVADGLNAAQAAADVQHGRRFVEDAVIVAAAVAAGYEHRADYRQPDLAAVVVARQHQVH